MATDAIGDSPPELAPSTPDSVLDTSNETALFDNRQVRISPKRCGVSDHSPLRTVRISFGDGGCNREEVPSPAAKSGPVWSKDAMASDGSSNSMATTSTAGDATLAGWSTTPMNYVPRYAQGGGRPGQSKCNPLSSLVDSSFSLLSCLVAPFGEVFGGSSGGFCENTGLDGLCSPSTDCSVKCPPGYGEEGRDGDDRGESCGIVCPSSDDGPSCEDAAEGEQPISPQTEPEEDEVHQTLGIARFRGGDARDEDPPNDAQWDPRPARTNIFHLALGSGLFVDHHSIVAFSSNGIGECDEDEEIELDECVPAFGTQLTRIDECELDEKETDAAPSPTSVSADLSPSPMNRKAGASSPPPIPGRNVRSRMLAKVQRRFAGPRSRAGTGKRTDREATDAKSVSSQTPEAETESCPSQPASPQSARSADSTSQKLPDSPASSEKSTINTSFDSEIEERRVDDQRRAKETRLQRAKLKRRERRREAARTVLLTGSLR